jgi:hypothetical protein
MVPVRPFGIIEKALSRPEVRYAARDFQSVFTNGGIEEAAPYAGVPAKKTPAHSHSCQQHSICENAIEVLITSVSDDLQ